jgi:hypothetical protein
MRRRKKKTMTMMVNMRKKMMTNVRKKVMATNVRKKVRRRRKEMNLTQK